MAQAPQNPNGNSPNRDRLGGQLIDGQLIAEQLIGGQLLDGQLIDGRSDRRTEESLPISSDPSQFSAESPDTTADMQLQRGWSLRRRLLLTLIPSILIPLGLLGGIGIWTAQQRAAKGLEEKLESQAELAIEIVSDVIRTAQVTPETIAKNPLIIEAARVASLQAETNGLPNLSIDQVEQRFASTKLLSPNQQLNEYLQSTAQSMGLAELFFTERNGYNVAFSNKTSDFVQSDEAWWQQGQAEIQWIDSPDVDESAGTFSLALIQAITDPDSGEVLGVMKAVLPAEVLDIVADYLDESGITGSTEIDIIDLRTGQALEGITAQGVKAGNELTIDPVLIEVASFVSEIFKTAENDLSEVEAAELADMLDSQFPIENVEIDAEGEEDEGEGELEFREGTLPTISFRYNRKHHSLTLSPDIPWAAGIATIDLSDFTLESSKETRILLIEMAALSALAILVAWWLSNQVSQPLAKLTDATEGVSAGNLNVTAPVEGTRETRTLAESFNNLVARVKDSLLKQEAATNEQRQLRESLENDIYQLIEDMEGAVDGDLTGRASLNSEDMSTVADLFNAMIENLREIAIEVKRSSGQVNQSLGSNEIAIRELADRAILEAKDIRKTLASVEVMSQSVQNVAENASLAATIANDAYATVKDSSSAMAQSVDSILKLRSTVGETSKKMKRLGESSQKISQVVSLIDEIALKTNLLAINASVEASRAGEQGQGFTVVAEQVGALAEQSSAATKEIAQIIAGIQAETQEVSAAMEIGTAQVVDSSRLVETTKANLDEVLNKSQEIDRLMQSISSTTDSQSTASQEMTGLMQQITINAEQRSAAARDIAVSTQSTAKVARSLQEAVAQFKVDDTAEDPPAEAGIIPDPPSTQQSQPSPWFN
ncbi:MAG: methyl-accepting chemotaxis protein [Synechococcus sp.]